MPAPLSSRIKERYMAKRSGGLSQQVAADAAGISVRTAQRIDGSGRNDQAQKPEPPQGRLKVISSRARCHASQCEHSPDVVAQFLLARVN